MRRDWAVANADSLSFQRDRARPAAAVASAASLRAAARRSLARARSAASRSLASARSAALDLGLGAGVGRGPSHSGRSLRERYGDGLAEIDRPEPRDLQGPGQVPGPHGLRGVGIGECGLERALHLALDRIAEALPGRARETRDRGIEVTQHLPGVAWTVRAGAPRPWRPGPPAARRRARPGRPGRRVGTERAG